MQNKKIKFMDGYNNLNKKIGTKEGAIFSTNIVPVLSSSEDRDSNYTHSGLMNLVVTTPINDAFLTGITSSNDSIMKLFESNKSLLIEMVTNIRVFGCSWLYVDKEKVLAFSPLDLSWSSVELNPLRSDYLQPKNVYLSIIGDELDMNNLYFFSSHGSNRLKADSLGMGISIVDVCLESVLRYGVAMTESVDILTQLNQNVIKMYGLNELIEDGRIDDLMSRLDVINTLKSNNSSILLDKEDDFINVSKSVSGVRDIIQETAVNVSSIAKIPYSRLFSKTSSGLGDSNKGDLINYYDTVVSDIRELYVEPIFDTLLDINGVSGEWEFESIYQESRLEHAEAYKIEIDNARMLLESGLISEDKAMEMLKLK